MQDSKLFAVPNDRGNLLGKGCVAGNVQTERFVRMCPKLLGLVSDKTLKALHTTSSSAQRQKRIYTSVDEARM